MSSLTAHILRYPVVTSTNEVLKKLAADGAVPGTVVVAQAQTAGRGRGDHTWHSPKGGLYLSALLTQSTSGRFTNLSLLSGVALAQSVKTILPKNTRVSLKWPNDCLIDGKKVGGILSEALGSGEPPLCVVGVGLNVNVAKTELLSFGERPFGATSMAAQFQGEGAFSLEIVTQALVRKLFMLHALYLTQGIEPVRYLWEKNCGQIGQTISLRGGAYRENGEIKADLDEASGIFLGIDATGALVLSLRQGGQRAYFAGEITCCSS